MKDRKDYYKEYRSKSEVKEKQRVHQQNWRDRNPKDSIALSKRNRDKHRDQFNKHQAAKRKKEIQDLHPSYIKNQLRQHFQIMAADVPDELIKIEQLRLLTKRKLKQNGNHNLSKLFSRHEAGIKRKPPRTANRKKEADHRKGSK